MPLRHEDACILKTTAKRTDFASPNIIKTMPPSNPFKNPPANIFGGAKTPFANMPAIFKRKITARIK